MALMSFTFDAFVMIVFSMLLFAACLWALVAARDHVLAVRSGEEPSRIRTALPGLVIGVVAVAMYIYAVSVT